MQYLLLFNLYLIPLCYTFPTVKKDLSTHRMRAIQFAAVPPQKIKKTPLKEIIFDNPQLSQTIENDRRVFRRHDKEGEDTNKIEEDKEQSKDITTSTMSPIIKRKELEDLHAVVKRRHQEVMDLLKTLIQQHDVMMNKTKYTEGRRETLTHKDKDVESKSFQIIKSRAETGEIEKLGLKQQIEDMKKTALKAAHKDIFVEEPDVNEDTKQKAEELKETRKHETKKEIEVINQKTERAPQHKSVEKPRSEVNKKQIKVKEEIQNPEEDIEKGGMKKEIKQKKEKASKDKYSEKDMEKKEKTSLGKYPEKDMVIEEMKRQIKDIKSKIAKAPQDKYAEKEKEEMKKETKNIKKKPRKAPQDSYVTSVSELSKKQLEPEVEIEKKKKETEDMKRKTEKAPEHRSVEKSRSQKSKKLIEPDNATEKVMKALSLALHDSDPESSRESESDQNTEEKSIYIQTTTEFNLLDAIREISDTSSSGEDINMRANSGEKEKLTFNLDGSHTIIL